MHLDKFHRLRPCLWHLTTRNNWISIRKQAGEEGDYALAPTARLHGQADAPSFALDEPREACQPLALPWGEVLIRDQIPLVRRRKQLLFPEGWDLGRFCALLNEHVFFWPGNASGPTMPYGKKHFRYYLNNSDVKLTFLKLDTARVLGRYEPAARFTKVNTGAPASRKKTVERGPEIFLSAGEIGVPSEVVEVAFREELSLKRAEVTPVSESRMREHLGVDEK